MIVSFKHKGLQKFWETGSSAKIQQAHKRKLKVILHRLEIAQTIEDLNFPSFKLHQLKGAEKGIWSIWVNGNWRITFAFKNGQATIIDYRDYH